MCAPQAQRFIYMKTSSLVQSVNKCGCIKTQRLRHYINHTISYKIPEMIILSENATLFTTLIINILVTKKSNKQHTHKSIEISRFVIHKNNCYYLLDFGKKYNICSNENEFFFNSTNLLSQTTSPHLYVRILKYFFLYSCSPYINYAKIFLFNAQ